MTNEPDLLHEASPAEIRRLREAILQYRSAILLMEAQLLATKRLLASKEQKLAQVTGWKPPVASDPKPQKRKPDPK